MIKKNLGPTTEQLLSKLSFLVMRWKKDEAVNFSGKY